MEIFRKMLFPFSLLYAIVTWLRNQLYDAKVLSSKAYDVPVICVGNLNTGGTGKSPMIEYLLELLHEDYKVASLSRGYKRNTKAYHLLSGEESAEETGDEPLQFKRKFKEVLVAVDANRQRGIEKLLEEKTEIILLDDAFQHRKVRAGFNILLSSYKDLYINDLVLPTGNLREPAVGAERAKLIVITKCPENLTKKEQERITGKLRLRNYQKLFFTYIDYSQEVSNSITSVSLNNFRNEKVTLVTGIANPAPLEDHLTSLGIKFKHLRFSDHHNFSALEVKKLQNEELIITTEKDFTRLKGKLKKDRLYYLPIKVGFIKDKHAFDKEIFNYIK